MCGRFLTLYFMIFLIVVAGIRICWRLDYYFKATASPAFYISTSRPLVQTTDVHQQNPKNEKDTTGSDFPIRVVLVPSVQNETLAARFAHLIMDGIQQSPRLAWADDDNDDSAVWLVEVGYGMMKWGNQNWCTTVGEEIQRTQRLRQQAGRPKPTWPVVLLDYDDYPPSDRKLCPQFGELLGNENVVYSFRSIAKSRSWNRKEKWVNLGRKITPTIDFDPAVQNYHYKHRPIGVRTDIVQAIDMNLKEQGLSLCQDMEYLLKRDIDVGYFWQGTGSPGGEVALRNTVFRALNGMKTTKTDWNMFVGLSGNRAHQGRQFASVSYVETLLRCKIVVVVQRDKWEDHYRLFEAIVAGALVLTDFMFGLPKGLVDGVSIVQYNSTADLQGKLEYYVTHERERLAIARAGRRIAMERHRSWHHMEEMILGATMTICDDTDSNQCPFGVTVTDMDLPCGN